MEKMTLVVPNISCNHCVHTIRMELLEIAGVKDVSAEVQSKEVQVSYEAPATESEIRKVLAEINYPANE